MIIDALLQPQTQEEEEEEEAEGAARVGKSTISLHVCIFIISPNMPQSLC